MSVQELYSITYMQTGLGIKSLGLMLLRGFILFLDNQQETRLYRMSSCPPSLAGIHPGSV